MNATRKTTRTVVTVDHAVMTPAAGPTRDALHRANRVRAVLARPKTAAIARAVNDPRATIFQGSVLGKIASILEYKTTKK
jgi:hypothetical protein